MASLNISLTMLTEEQAPDGISGWYVTAFLHQPHYVSITTDEGTTELAPGSIIEALSIPEESARIIGRAFNDAVSHPINPVGYIKAPPIVLVEMGNNMIKKAIVEELAFAENQAKKIAGLRKRLESLEKED